MLAPPGFYVVMGLTYDEKSKSFRTFNFDSCHFAAPLAMWMHSILFESSYLHLEWPFSTYSRA